MSSTTPTAESAPQERAAEPRRTEAAPAVRAVLAACAAAAAVSTPPKPVRDTPKAA